MQRRGDKYELTYDDSDLPDHYGWKAPSKLAELGRDYALARKGKSTSAVNSQSELAQRASKIIAALDSSGR